MHGRELLEHDDGGAGAGARARSARSTGWTCSTSAWPGARACSPTTRCAWRSTCAARRASGYELAPLLREIDDINLELYGQNVLVAVFGMGERGLPEAARLVAALRTAVERVGLDPGGRGRASRRRRRGGSWR